MFGRNIYRDEAVLGHAQQEPLDTPARVDVPHQHIAWRILTALFLLTLAWIALGSKERDLWLTAVPLTGSPSTQTVPNTTLEFSSFVSQSMTPHLRVGMEVDVLFRKGAKKTSRKGRLISLRQVSSHSNQKDDSEHSTPHGTPYRFVVKIPPAQTIDPGHNLHGLRLVIGQQRLYEFLLQLAFPRTRT